jgi:uncharacterized membrane protein
MAVPGALAALPCCLLAACAAGPRLVSDLDTAYTAAGADPSWQLHIAYDQIRVDSVLLEGHRSFPRTAPRQEGDRRIWRSRSDYGTLTVETRPGPCEAGGELVSDRVRVTFNTLVFSGCGGLPVRRDGGA